MKKIVWHRSSFSIFLSLLFSIPCAFATSKNVFEGAYIGGNFGYALGYSPYNIYRTIDNPLTNYFSSNTLGDLGLKRPVGGLQLGYNQKYSYKRFNGIEFSWDIPQLYLKGKEICEGMDTTQQNIKAKREESFGLAFKTSQKLGRTSLGYLKLGVKSTKWATKISGSLFRSFPSNIQNADSNHDWLLGAELGLGAETMLSPKLSLGLEGSYSFYRPTSTIHFSTISNDNIDSETYSISTRLHPRALDVRLRLGWYI